DFFISLIIYIGLMFWYKFFPNWRIVTIPLFLCLALFVALGTGFLISALNVKYRDFRYIIPFIVQFGLYISPVGFSTSIVPEKWKLLYCLNPMVGVIDGFRWAILGENIPLYLPGLLSSIIMSLILLIFGFKYFRKMEKAFADVI
ncbi:MAG: ABC transporter permease, partial [Candidatus Firestonebacteria bacterium]|nr:ABC transporter permease [Candidatus Firestonebacteria bacterium]